MGFQEFAKQLDRYKNNLGTAGPKASHDLRRAYFIDFLKEAFGIDVSELSIEEHVKVAEVSGFIDTLYRSIIFEFKKDLARERDTRVAEIKKYFKSKPYSVYAFLTEGFNFEVYRPADDEPAKIASIDIRKSTERDVWLFFDAYLFSESTIVPDSVDVVKRFGLTSPTYLSTKDILVGLWKRAKDDSAVQTKFGEWDRLLAKVYGKRIGSDELFLRHTYLSLLAKVFAYAALFHDADKHGDQLSGIVNGELFAEEGYVNLAEEDFFAWILADPFLAETLDLIQILTARLRTIYDFRQVKEDLLKELYQNLVDPSTRHTLGEFYTPDWLAELTLNELGYPQERKKNAKLKADTLPSVLDPACGSGTFLFTCIRLARRAGLKGRNLAEYALTKVMGMDVHPLAITIAKVNVVLALAEELPTYEGELRLPVYMADSVQPTKGIAGGDSIITVSVADPKEKDNGKAKGKSNPESYVIPADLAADRKQLDLVVDEMQSFAKHNGEQKEIIEGFWNSIAQRGIDDKWKPYWLGNCRLLYGKVRSGTDTIWAFILKNCCQPAYIRQHPVDIVVGNPPWLTFKDIKNREYQEQVRALTFAYGLLTQEQAKLFTHLEMASLFFVHCLTEYLKPDGKIAFVMPRTVITGSKHHELFRKRGFRKILDCKAVTHRTPTGPARSIFNVPSCVLFADHGQCPTTDIPCKIITGEVPTKNALWEDAEKYLDFTDSTYTPPPPGEPSPYLESFDEGATILPRTLWFVRKASKAKLGAVNAARPRLETNPGIDEDAKEPWKGLRVKGAVEKKFLYATLRGEGLLPFGVRFFDLVVLPVERSKGLVHVLTTRQASKRGCSGLVEWLSQVEKHWEKHKKETSSMTAFQRINYHRTLQDQKPRDCYRVVYNKSGTNIACCVVDTNNKKQLRIDGLQANGFFADTVTIAYATDSIDEAHYLCAVLNSTFVNEAIKQYQTQGLWGPRDIHRRPLEVVPIPAFDKDNALCCQLAQFSKDCHEKVANNIKSVVSLKGGAGKARGFVRGSILSDEIAKIDEVTIALLKVIPAKPKRKNQSKLFDKWK